MRGNKYENDTISDAASITKYKKNLFFFPPSCKFLVERGKVLSWKCITTVLGKLFFLPNPWENRQLRELGEWISRKSIGAPFVWVGGVSSESDWGHLLRKRMCSLKIGVCFCRRFAFSFCYVMKVWEALLNRVGKKKSKKKGSPIV